VSELELDKFLDDLKLEIDKGTAELDTIKLEIDKARVVGLDVRELTERYDGLCKQIELVKLTYKL